MFPKFMMLTCCCLSLAACAEKTPYSVPDSADFVAVTLGQAAEQAHGDLTMLARLRGQGLQPLLPPPDPALAHPITTSPCVSMRGAKLNAVSMTELNSSVLWMSWQYRHDMAVWKDTS